MNTAVDRLRRIIVVASIGVILASSTAVLFTGQASVYAQPATQAACEDAGMVWLPEPNDEGVQCTANKTDCKIEDAPGLGIAICPIARFLAGLSDQIYTTIIQQLLVLPSLTQNPALQQAWGATLSIANVAFVIAFLFVIYSQITGMGISNYGIKKMLPKLVVGAILINLSFWICALAVDLSNIAGGSLYSVLNAIGQASLPEGDAAGADNRIWGLLITALLAGAGTVAAFVISPPLAQAALTFVLPALLAVVVALIVGFVVIALRQGLAVILTILAPLAFAAALLPNTENWFDRWKKLFITVLVFYPLFAVVFGGAQVAGNVLIGISAAPENQGENALIGLILLVVGLLVIVLPLFMAPFLWKYSGGLLGKIAGKINDRGSGLTGAVDKGMGKIRERKMKLAGANWRASRLKAGNKINTNKRTSGRFRWLRRKAADVRRYTNYRMGGMGERLDEAKVKGAEDAQDKYYAQEITNNQKLAKRAGGKHGSAGGAVAQAQNELLEIEIENAEAQQVSIANAVVDGRELTRGLTGETVSGGTGQQFNGSDTATWRAMLREALEKNNHEAIEAAYEHARTSDDLSLRRAAADELNASKNKPAWYSQGALSNLRAGKSAGSDGSAEKLRESAVRNGTYSAEKASNTHHGEMAQMATTLQRMSQTTAANDTGTIAAMNRFRADANTALTDPQLRRNVGRNVTALESIRSTPTRPTPPNSPSSTP